LPRRPRRYRRGVAAVAAVMVVAAAAVTAVTMTSHQPRTATPPSAAALSPTSSSTTPPQPPIVTRSRLPGLLPPLDDVKNFVGIQNLVAHEPMLQPQTPNGSINPAECWPAVGGGVPSAYDLGTVIGFYGLTIDEPPTGTAPNQVGQLIVAFRDAATAQRHLADLASIWRRCGGRTVTLFRSEWRRPVELSTSVPEVVDGITTMVLTAQGPVLRVREDHAIAAKNNVLVDVDIMTPDTSRGQQAVIGITNYILAKIPG
ncbi:sensor domain-containing protein, partial [Mycobacterium tuberculosis]